MGGCDVFASHLTMEPCFNAKFAKNYAKSAKPLRPLCVKTLAIFALK